MDGARQTCYAEDPHPHAPDIGAINGAIRLGKMTGGEEINEPTRYSFRLNIYPIN